MYKNIEEYDVVGIGFGPGNIALAISLEEKNFTNSILFLESNTAPDWQAEMLLDGSDIQHNPLRDFVTPRNPVSRYGFLSYLKSENRLFEYLNLGLEYPLRKDYARYVRWVARQFDKWVSYGEKVTSIELESKYGNHWIIKTSLNRTIAAKSLSMGPGRTPYIPPSFENKKSSRVVHFTNYTSALSRWTSEEKLKSVAVIGNSQSAVELVLDLSSRFSDVSIHNLFRSYSYQLKDVSPFTEQIYFPEFVDEFYNLGIEKQKEVTQRLWRSNYSSADHDVLHNLHVKIYEQKLDGREYIHLHNMADIQSVEETSEGIKIDYQSTLTGKKSSISVDSVILATGFRNLGGEEHQELFPPLLNKVAGSLKRREDNSLLVERDYKLVGENCFIPPVYLNGLCESTHGFGDAGSFSLLSVRSWTIAESIEQYFCN
ncbi:SidA/IucD/PvdA family monooxygenase [Hahella sp. CR1]|uniref:SidA/IucD/PvdA family monooxygenase n=1 Tax=Hahella sp. CR1 TaxID=2992807 RepID=UPI0024423824|nr:SidA/IucD/PvdA family monooxygenase [Hahella sp. CR1]MDG9668711.1 SidA/IucD/PvdA family monooxygenase [Hahella sp. CR1]